MDELDTTMKRSDLVAALRTCLSNHICPVDALIEEAIRHLDSQCDTEATDWPGNRCTREAGHDGYHNFRPSPHEQKATQYWCRKCEWRGYRDELREDVLHPGGLYEPEDIELYCPECNATYDHIIEREPGTVYCTACEEEPVSDEGEMCTECYTCMVEAHVDASREGL